MYKTKMSIETHQVEKVDTGSEYVSENIVSKVTHLSDDEIAMVSLAEIMSIAFIICQSNSDQEISEILLEVIANGKQTID